MKIQTQNKLAHYQAEYQEVTEQTQMLRAQLPSLQQQILNMEAYLRVNNGDRKARTDYGNLVRRYNSLNNTIKRNCMRLETLNRQIAIENQKIINAQQRQMMIAYHRGSRNPNYYY